MRLRFFWFCVIFVGGDILIIMRLVYRNRRAALIGTLCVFGVMMLLIKYTEIGPMCISKEEQSPIMVRDDVSIMIFQDIINLTIY